MLDGGHAPHRAATAGSNDVTAIHHSGGDERGERNRDDLAGKDREQMFVLAMSHLPPPSCLSWVNLVKRWSRLVGSFSPTTGVKRVNRRWYRECHVRYRFFRIREDQSFTYKERYRGRVEQSRDGEVAERCCSSSDSSSNERSNGFLPR